MKNKQKILIVNEPHIFAEKVIYNFKKRAFVVFEANIKQRTYDDIAKQAGLSKQRVDHLIQKAVNVYKLKVEDYDSVIT